MPVPSDESAAGLQRARPASLLVLRLLCLLALAVALLPYLDSGFYSDDIFNSTLRGHLRISGMSLWQCIAHEHHVWLVSNGRFFPVGIAIISVLWDVAKSRLAYRCIQVSLVALNLIVCARLLKRVSGSRLIPLVFLAVLPAFFQVRAWHDPMTSFGGLLQLTLL